jgi:exodeoxyribonuclease VII large subunit
MTVRVNIIKAINVSQLNSYIKRVLSSDPVLSDVTVKGEISNFKYHSNGHVYFTLKDDGAAVNCFLPGGVYRSLRFEIGNGLEINANGYINLYERGGTYSLNIRSVSVEGEGNLQAAFDKMRAKLEAEGLFDERFKKPLPAFPRTVAIVTSETGAAIEDMLKIITKRNNYVDVLIYPSLVQGPGAAQQIAAGIEYINKERPDTDVIIIGRGGGSREDLWAFNEEVLARAVFASVIPVVSGVGHEPDVSITDYVADKRAETPTAAAQMVVPDIRQVREYLDGGLETLRRNAENRFDSFAFRVSRADISHLAGFIGARVDSEMRRIGSLRSSGEGALARILSQKMSIIDGKLETLAALDPHSVMKRGYAALTDARGGLLSSVSDFKKDMDVTAVVSDGKVELWVK